MLRDFWLPSIGWDNYNLFSIMKNFFYNEHVQSFIHTLVTDYLWDAFIWTALATSLSTQGIKNTLVYAIGYGIFRTLPRVLRRKYFTKNEDITEPTLDDIRKSEP